MHDAAKDFVDAKQAAQAGVDARDLGVAVDEQTLHKERARRYDQKSIFNDANPGGKRELEPPLTTQWEFYTGGGDRPDQRP